MATKSAWQKSEFGKIKWVNILNAAYHAVIAVGTLYFAEPQSALGTLAIPFRIQHSFSPSSKALPPIRKVNHSRVNNEEQDNRRIGHSF